MEILKNSFILVLLAITIFGIGAAIFFKWSEHKDKAKSKEKHA